MVIILGITFSWMMQMDLSSHKLNKRQLKILSYVSSDNGARLEWGKCFLGTSDSPQKFSDVCAGNRTNPQLLFFGDSHAAMIASELKNRFTNMARYSSAGCAPIVDSKLVSENCMDFNLFILQKLEELQPKYIFIKSNWRDSTSNGLFDKHFSARLKEMILEIKVRSPKSNIFLLGNTPQWYPNLPIILVRYGSYLEGNLYLPNTELRYLRMSDVQLRAIAQSAHVNFVSLLPFLCKKQSCLAVTSFGKKTEPLLFDNSHLTATGSKLVANYLANYLKRAM